MNNLTDLFTEACFEAMKEYINLAAKGRNPGKRPKEKEKDVTDGFMMVCFMQAQSCVLCMSIIYTMVSIRHLLTIIKVITLK